MLDRYVSGSAGRISPEAPAPVVRVDRVEERPGGAANVAANIRSLGVGVSLAGITGDDGQAGFLESALAELEVCYRCYRLPGAPTITKLRVLSQNQQLLRLDYEEEFPPSAADRMPDIYAEQLPGAGRSRSFNDIARLLIDWRAGGRIQYMDFPEGLPDAYQSFTEADISALREAGHRKPFTGLEQGTRKYLEHIEAVY